MERTMSDTKLSDDKCLEDMLADFQQVLDLEMDEIRSDPSLKEVSILSNGAGIPEKISTCSDTDPAEIADDETVQTLMSMVKNLEAETEKRQRDYQKQLDRQFRLMSKQSDMLKDLEPKEESKTPIFPGAVVPQASLKKIKYYAVARGRKPGIYTSRDEVDDHIEGFSGAMYKTCSSFSKAEEYVQKYLLTKDLAKDKRIPSEEKEETRKYVGVSSISFSGVFLDLSEVPTSAMTEGKMNLFDTAAEAADWVKAHTAEIEQQLIRKEREQNGRNLAKYKNTSLSTSLIFKHAGKKFKGKLCT